MTTLLSCSVAPSSPTATLNLIKLKFTLIGWYRMPRADYKSSGIFVRHLDEAMPSGARGLSRRLTASAENQNQTQPRPCCGDVRCAVELNLLSCSLLSCSNTARILRADARRSYPDSRGCCIDAGSFSIWPPV